MKKQIPFDFFMNWIFIAMQNSTSTCGIIDWFQDYMQTDWSIYRTCFPFLATKQE